MGKHELKQTWLVIAVGYGLLMLGPAGGLHRILYYVYPPLWFTRHTHGFVFFFMFAFLYFYVLGFNHIFGSWNTSLFPASDRTRKGILSTLIGDTSSGKYLPLILSSIILSACIVYAIYWMTELRYPETNYLFLLVFAIFLIGWILRNDLGRAGMYASLILGYVVFALISCENDESRFLIRCFLLLVVPLTVFIGIRAHHTLPKKNYIMFIVLAVFSASLVADMGYHLRLTTFLHRTQPHPQDIFDVVTNAQEPKPPERRGAASLSVVGATIQSLRYVSLVYRHPYVFSPLVAAHENPAAPYPHTVGSIAEVFQFSRWNSFYFLQNYFQLINSGVPPLAMEEMFCVGKPLFQFKQGIVAMTDEELTLLLTRPASRPSVQWLEKCVVIDRRDMDQFLAKFKVSEAECKVLAEGSDSPEEDKGLFSYRIKEYEHDCFRMEVVTDRDGILYWSDGFDDRWHAYVDGQEIPIYRANINFKAILLSKGSSHIQFVYEHTLFRVGLVAFFGTFCLALTLALITRLFSNKRSTS
jgi:hypothetical protein